MANVLTTYPPLKKKHHFYKRMKSDLKTVPKIELNFAFLFQFISMAYFHYLLLLQVVVVSVVTGANSNSGGNGNRAAQMASGNMGRSPGMAVMMREMMSGQSPNNAAGSSRNEALPFPGPRVIAPPNIPFGK